MFGPDPEGDCVAPVPLCGPAPVAACCAGEAGPAEGVAGAVGRVPAVAVQAPACAPPLFDGGALPAPAGGGPPVKPDGAGWP